MPLFLMIGIPLVVAVLLWGIMTLPDEEIDGEAAFDAKKSPKKVNKKK